MRSSKRILSSDFFSSKYLQSNQKYNYKKTEDKENETQLMENKFIYLEATWMILAVFSRNSLLPTLDPVAPAIRKVGFSTFPYLNDGTKSGKHDKTPCNDESIRKRVTFKWSFSFPT